MRNALMVLVLGTVFVQGSVRAQPVRIGAESVVPENPRSIYCRYVNWRPADGETVSLNPPRVSWPYRADWPENWGDALHSFTLEISANPDCSEPVVSATCPFNFYNTIPALKGSKRWYWRVGYDVGTAAEKWSDIRSFTIADDAVEWDRSALAEPDVAERGHPRVCFNPDNLEQLRALAETDPGSKAALEHMVRQADGIVQKDWWDDFPETDRQPEPKQAFYTIAGDLATVAFVWRMTGDDKYAGVRERAVTWASYPPGGRASPEGLGGDGNEDATQGNEFLALLFDWLYPDLSDDERQMMIQSLEWRTEHIMNTFSWKSRASKGPMLRLTFRSDAEASTYEAEDCALAGGARVIEHEKASGGKLVEFAEKQATLSKQVTLDAGPYAITVRGWGPAPDRDGFYVQLGDDKPRRLFIQGWGEASVSLSVPEAGEHTITLSADPNEVGMTVDSIRIAVHGDQRLKLAATGEWKQFKWEVPVPTRATRVAVEPFNYYARGEVWWDSIKISTTPDGPNLLTNGDFTEAEGERPAAWRTSSYGTESELRFEPEGGRAGTSAVGIICPDASDRGAWNQSIAVGDARKLLVEGWYRTSPDMLVAPVRGRSLSGQCSSHQFESSMDTAICGLVLYEHSEIGREWFELMLNYLIGVTSGFGFDEAWNEGAGYGTSKCKWLMNATMYFDTALPAANLGRNPYYRRIGDWFCRVIPVGMDHHAWGNQRNASRGNHLAHMRKFAYLTGEGRFLLNWQQYGGKQFSTWRPWIEYVLPAYYDTPTPEPEEDYVGLFDVSGWAMAATGPPSLRSTYEEGAGVIFQCRTRGGYSHSFNSDASFQLHAYGQMLNHGGGSSANQDAYAYHTMSHNTILIDGFGQAQPGSGMLYPTYGRTVGFARGDDYAYFAGDATRCYPKQPGVYRRWGLPIDEVYGQRALPYLERFVRHILFVRGKYFVIYDDLRCSQPARYTWLYHIRPEEPITFDQASFAVDYAVGEVKVRLQHIYQPGKLELDDREGEDALINPFTGEDYRQWRKGDILCGHNLWVTNTEPAETWHFLAVVYPQPPGGEIPRIERVDDNTLRVGEDFICFDPASAAAADADFLVDVAAMRER